MKRRAFFASLAGGPALAAIPEPDQAEAIAPKGYVITYKVGLPRSHFAELRKAWNEAFPGVPLMVLNGAEITRINKP